MKIKKNPKWVGFMNALRWENVNIWGEVTPAKFANARAACRQWVIDNRKYIGAEALVAFDRFFIAETKLESYEYALKERAVEAFAALYRKEQDHD